MSAAFRSILLSACLAAGFAAQRDAKLASDGFVTTADGSRLFFQKLGGGGEVVLFPNGVHLRDDFRRLAGGRTIIFYDLRNRGRSDPISDPAKLARGIHNDVDDLEAVRRHFGTGRVALIGHSYVGMIVALYALKYPAGVSRVVQIGPLQPVAGRDYPAHLTGADAVLARVMSGIAQLRKEPRPENEQEACEKFWTILRPIYVVDPADAAKVDWGRCDLPNERNFMQYWTRSILPSLESTKLAAAELARLATPVLTVHGARDRSSPYGGARDWVRMLPNARLLTVENAAHAPWVEAPGAVFGAISTFLDGTWPAAAKKVTALDPKDEPLTRK